MASKQNQGQSDDIGGIILLVTVMVLVVVAWYFLQPYFASAWIVYAKLETYALLATTPVEDVRYQAYKLLEWLDTATHETLDERMYVGARAQILSKGWHNYIIYILLIIVAFKVYKKNNRYRGVPTITSLLNTEHKVWPTLEFVRRFDPFKHWNEIKGQGRYMVSPFVFAVEQGFLKNYTAKYKKDRFFDDEAAVAAFTKVLGEKFKSFSALPPPQKALLTIIAAKDLDDKYDSYNDLVRWFAIEFSNVGRIKKTLARIDEFCNPLMLLLDDADVELGGHKLIDALVKGIVSNDESVKRNLEENPYDLTQSTLEFLTTLKNRHAYESTMMAGAARKVKRRGKFPPGRLVFFKPWDRQLFMVLSNTPYYVPDNESPYRFVSGFSAEVLPIFNHLQMELFAGRIVETPYFSNGIESIKRDLQQQNLIP